MPATTPVVFKVVPAPGGSAGQPPLLVTVPLVGPPTPALADLTKTTASSARWRFRRLSHTPARLGCRGLIPRRRLRRAYVARLDARTLLSPRDPLTLQPFPR